MTSWGNLVFVLCVISFQRLFEGASCKILESNCLQGTELGEKVITEKKKCGYATTDRQIVELREACKTTNGVTCMFPFTYQSKTYTSCTTVGSNQHWCYTSSRGNWGYCDMTIAACSGSKLTTPKPATPKTTASTRCITSNGRACIFPFSWSGKAYSTCTNADHNQYWCFTEGGGWGNCDMTNSACGGGGGGSEPKRDPTTGLPVPEQKENEMGTCMTTFNPPTGVSGVACQFPFKYDGKDYSGCVNMHSDLEWCRIDDANSTFMGNKWAFCRKDCYMVNNENKMVQPGKGMPLSKYGCLLMKMGWVDISTMSFKVEQVKDDLNGKLPDGNVKNVLLKGLADCQTSQGMGYSMDNDLGLINGNKILACFEEKGKAVCS